MAKLRDIVFEDMRKDYNEHGESSFLYGYLRNGKLKDEIDKDPANEKAIVHKHATYLMYDHGYPLAKRNKKKKEVDFAFMEDGISAEEEKRRVRKITVPARKDAKKKKAAAASSRTSNKALDLLDAWFAARGGKSLSLRQSVASEEEYQQLFMALSKGRVSQAFVPIMVDPLIGAGLYILGRDYYPEGKFRYASDWYCGLCIISEWVLEKGEGASLQFGIQSNSDNDLKGCKSVREAIKFFECDLLDKRRDYLNEIQIWNPAAPAGCPEKLRMYFADYYEEDDFDTITDEDRKLAEEDYYRR